MNSEVVNTERKPNKWITFLQEQAKKNKTSYAIELADKNNKELYKSRNTKSVAEQKPLSKKPISVAKENKSVAEKKPIRVAKEAKSVAEKKPIRVAKEAKRVAEKKNPLIVSKKQKKNDEVKEPFEPFVMMI